MTRRVVLLHGLWLPGASMRWHAARLGEAGFAPEIFCYPTIGGGPTAALPRLIESLARADTHVLAHSLGGLVALTALQREPDLPVRRMVCLGSPLCGSAAATGLAGRRLTAVTLGRSAGLLQRGCGCWEGAARIGMIAGNTALGLGRYFGRLEGPSDGTVAVAETRLPGLADHVVIPTSHTGLLFSVQAARLVAGFLRTGQFQEARSGDGQPVDAGGHGGIE